MKALCKSALWQIPGFRYRIPKAGCQVPVTRKREMRRLGEREMNMRIRTHEDLEVDTGRDLYETYNQIFGGLVIMINKPENWLL